jgi:hypothetical protein
VTTGTSASVRTMPPFAHYIPSMFALREKADVGYIVVASIILAFSLWKIAQSVTQRKIEMPYMAVVGDSNIHKRFLDSHVPFLREFHELQKLDDKMRDAALEKYNQPPQTEPEGQELEKYTGLRLAQIIVLYLARTTSDAFNDVFVLAGNCRGFAAKMMLRPMYEHLVTASYIALKPEEAKRFDDHAVIEKWKVWNRTLKVVPKVKDIVPAEDIVKLDEKQKAVRAQLKSEICKTCKQPITQEAWTRVNVDTMAEQVDAASGTSLVNLYAPCYLMPTAMMHPTSLGLEARLERTEGGFGYKDLPEAEAHDSLMRAHGLVLRLFKLMNNYFDLGMDTEVSARWEAFPKIWDGALADPPAEAELVAPEEQKKH